MNELYRQDGKWSVTELAGDTCVSFFGLTYEEAENYPEILFLQLENGEWHRCYLDAYFGFWNETELNDLSTIIASDYDGARKIDYLKKYGLAGQPISRIWCDRDDVSTFISIEFGNGTVEFREFNDENRVGEIDFISTL